MATDTPFSTEIGDCEAKKKTSFYATKYPFCEIKNNYIKLKTFSMYIEFFITSNVRLRCKYI